MLGGDHVGSAYVDINLDASPAERELAAFHGKLDRSLAEIGRKKAEATLRLKSVEFDKKINEARGKLDYFKGRRSSATLDLAKKHFDEQVAAATAELKALGKQKTTIQLDSRQLREANKSERLLADARALSEQRAVQSAKSERMLANERSRATTSTIKARAEIAKLSAAYEKLLGRQAAMEKSNRRVFSSRSVAVAEAEARKLERVGSEADLVKHRIEQLGGSVDGLDPRIKRNTSFLDRWLSRLGDTSVRLGPITTSIKGIAAGLGLLGPLVFGLAGGLTSLIGTMGAGLAGAAAVGAGALGGLATSALGVGLIVKPMVSEFKEVATASTALHKAVLKYGKGSEQAKTAQEHLNSELHGVSPIAKEAFKSYGSLKDRWKELTKAARPAVFSAFGESLKTVQSLLPSFASESTKTTQVSAKAWDGWMKSLRSSEAKKILGSVMSDFRASIPGLTSGLASLGAMIGRIAAAGAHFLPGLSNGFADWANNLEHAVGGGQKLQNNVGGLVHQMQDLGHLAQDTGSLLVHIFSASASSGNGLVKSLDTVIKRWDAWTQSTSGESGLKEFFGESQTVTEDFMGSLSHAATLLFEFSRATAPVANGLLKIVTFMGDVVTAADELVGVKTIFQDIGFVLAGLFVASKVAAYGDAIKVAGARLGIWAAEEDAATLATEANTTAIAEQTLAMQALATASGEAALAGAGAEAGVGAGAGAGAAAGVGAGAAAGGGAEAIGGAALGGPLTIAAAAVGGAFVASVINEIHTHAATHSDDFVKAISAMADTQGGLEKTLSAVIGTEINVGVSNAVKEGVGTGLASAGGPAGPILNALNSSGLLNIGELIFGKSKSPAAENLKAQLDEISKKRVKISEHTREQLELDAKEVNLTDKARIGLDKVFSAMRESHELGIKFDAKVPLEALNKLHEGFKKLKSPSLTGFSDINKVLRENTRLVPSVVKNAVEARHAIADNFRLAAHDIKRGIESGAINAERGMHRIQQLMRNANLLEGNDPLGIASGFATSWKKAGHINERETQRMITELGKMPPRARKEAVNMMLALGRGLVSGGQIPKKDFQAFKSALLTEVGGLGAGFNQLSGTVYEALAGIGSNLREALSNLGLKAPSFNLKAAIAGLPQLKPMQHENRKQQGGFIVPGAGDGDKVYRELPQGSFVMNREATNAFGLQGGGMTPTLLEPKERVFMPHEVAQHGAGNLAAMNAAVPRQKGGSIGPEPQISGPAGAMLDLGQGAVKRAYTAAEKYFNAHRPKGGAGYTGPATGPAGTSMFKGILMATWVRQALEYASTRGAAPQPTSGYRPGFDPYAPSGSEHAKTQYPGGAVDFGGFVDPAAAVGRDAVVRATRSFRYPLLHPIGFHDDGHASGTGHMLGGFIQELAKGAKVGDRTSTRGEVTARTRDLMEHIWGTAAPFYGASAAAMPRTDFNTHQYGGAFLGDVRNRKGGTNYVIWPKWAEQRLLKGDHGMEQVLLHEWAHYFQRPDVFSNTASAEGGAQGFARWAAPQVYGALGMPYSNPGHDVYGKYIRQMRKSHGQNWFEHEQFRQNGGMIGLQQGGSPASWIHGSSTLNADQLATLAHYAGAKSPGLMSQIAQAESGGNPRSMGGAGDKGLWQIIPSTASAFGIDYGQLFDPLANAQGMNKIAFTGGAGSPAQGLTAWSTYNSGAYRGYSKGAVSALGGAATGAAKHELPKAVSANYTKHWTGFHGEPISVKHHDKIQLEVPSFGALPKGEDEIKRELHEVEQVMLPKYQAALAEHGKNKAIAAALQKSIAVIRKRISELRSALRTERITKAKAHTKKRIQRQLSRVLGMGDRIESAEHLYEKADQDALQTVELEPEQTGEITHDWVDHVLTPYIDNQEAPAYAHVLDTENTWRNTALDAEAVARQQEKMWELSIGYPKTGRQPSLENPDLHYPERGPKDTSASGLASWIYAVYDEIQREQAYIHSHSSAWFNEHPQAKELREQYQRDLPQFRGKLSQATDRRTGLIGALGEGREQAFDWYKGTGSFEDSMVSVQGLHWPDQHEKLAGLPSGRVAGMFGGAIWDTQSAIGELGLKIKQANESISTPEAPDKSGEFQAFSDAIMNLLSGETFFMISRGGAQPFAAPYMGAHAAGGVALVGERGPELAYMPNGTRITDATETERLLDKQVGSKTIVNNHFAGPPPDPHTWARQQEFELGALS